MTVIVLLFVSYMWEHTQYHGICNCHYEWMNSNNYIYACVFTCCTISMYPIKELINMCEFLSIMLYTEIITNVQLLSEVGAYALASVSESIYIVQKLY